MIPRREPFGEGLAARLRARLRPLDAETPGEAPARSDFDLNPDVREIPGILAPAAVLVALTPERGEPSVLLTRRSEALRRHSGQVALPGGRREPGETAAEAAVREAWEEIGLEPDRVDPVGLGDAYETRTGFSITPVVAFVRAGYVLRPDPAEVAEIFEAPFRLLMDPQSWRLHATRGDDGRERRYYALEHDGRLIWGATAGLLRALSQRLYGAAAAASWND